MLVAESVQTERMQAERDELAWLLRSRGLGRSANLVRVLRFICEEHFAGRGSDLKEYTIAVEALGRRPDFDPQTDTIVRVTVHSLRKRLLEIYDQEGAERPLRLVVPPGHYIPSFLPNAAELTSAAPRAVSSDFAEPEGGSLSVSMLTAGSLPAEAIPEIANSAAPTQRWKQVSWIATCAGILLIAAAAGLTRHNAGGSTIAPLKTPAGPLNEVRTLLGTRHGVYTDRAGQVWSPGNFCSGGDTVPAPKQGVAGTEDSPLFDGGIRGIARCAFLVKPGLYELHFFFSEPSDLPIATRVAQYSINAGPFVSYDVVDEAGGSGRATSTVVAGVAPENDGSIHVDYISEVSPLNALEIVPSPSGKLLPIRIVASLTPVTDSEGQRWMPDRYFTGGRRGQASGTASGVADIYSSDRIGRFSYSIPVVPQAHYRVRLFFKDPWFGPGNGGKGGPGSRVFDVACNGRTLLNHFDILAEGHGGAVTKTFDDVQASTVGRLDLTFSPVVNYPIVNSIEVSATE